MPTVREGKIEATPTPATVMTVLVARAIVLVSAEVVPAMEGNGKTIVEETQLRIFDGKNHMNSMKTRILW